MPCISVQLVSASLTAWHARSQGDLCFFHDLFLSFETCGVSVLLCFIVSSISVPKWHLLHTC